MKKYIKTFLDVLFLPLAVSIFQHTNCTDMHIYIEISDVVYALKEIPQGAKDTKD